MSHSSADLKPEGGRIRVCLATPSFYPAFSGAALRFQRYAPMLSARGIDLEVFCATPTAVKAGMAGISASPEEFEVGQLLPREVVDDLPVHRIFLPEAVSRRRVKVYFKGLYEHCRRTRPAPDVVQLLSLSPHGVLPLRGIRRLGIGLVYTSTMVSRTPPGPIRRTLLRLRRWVTLDLMDIIVTSSEVMRRSFDQVQPRSPIVVIPNGVDTQQFRPPQGPDEKEAIRERLGIGLEEPVVLFVGAVMPRKGVDLLLEMWTPLIRECPRARLLIVGPRRDQFDPDERDFHKRLKSILASSPNPSSVTFLGVVDNVAEYMRAADAFVFPSRREGMGNAVLEAMASGLPVVMTPFLGLPDEFGRPGDEYVLAGSDPNELSQAVLKVLRDGALRDRLSASSRACMLEGMTISKSAASYATLYRRLAELPPSDKLARAV